MNLTGCEIRFVLFGPYGRVEEWSLTLNIRCSHIIAGEIKPIEDWDLVTDVYQKAQL